VRFLVVGGGRGGGRLPRALGLQAHTLQAYTVHTREMENISRDPTFGDFVTILTEGSVQDITNSPLPPLLNVTYCVRVSLRTVKIFLAQH
jgi:hypothetical protein